MNSTVKLRLMIISLLNELTNEINQTNDTKELTKLTGKCEMLRRVSEEIAKL